MKEPRVAFQAILWEDFAVRVYKRSSSQVRNGKGDVKKFDPTKII